LNGVGTRIAQHHNYPWEGKIEIDVEPESAVEGRLLLRLPSWAEEYELSLSGEPLDHTVESGYLVLRRKWIGANRLTLELPMNPRVLRADPRVAEDRGKVAFARGPLVYCFESADNEAPLDIVSAVMAAPLEERWNRALPEAAVSLTVSGSRDREERSEGELYRQPALPRVSATLTAIPYFLWDNRAAGKMKVWIPAC